MYRAVAILAMLVFTATLKATEPNRVPVQIKVTEVHDDQVKFQTIVSPEFAGILVKGNPDKHITQCEATSEPVASLKNGGEVVSMVLNCKPDIKIVVMQVLF